MDIKRLYSDMCVFCGEVPVYTFLTYCDMCARSLLQEYGEKLCVGEGEYMTPASLSDTFALDDAFYNAVLLFAAGKALGDEKLFENSRAEAENAYKNLWRKAARGKRVLGVKW